MQEVVDLRFKTIDRLKLELAVALPSPLSFGMLLIVFPAPIFTQEGEKQIMLLANRQILSKGVRTYAGN